MVLIRTGVHTYPTDFSVYIVELAREAELRDLDALWLSYRNHLPVGSRHLFTCGGRDSEAFRGLLHPYIAGAAAATANRTLWLGDLALKAPRHSSGALPVTKVRRGQ